jgi:hypothetical protein
VGLGPRVIDWAVVFDEDEEAHYHGWRFAFPALRDQYTSCMTCGPRPPCHRPGCFGARRARFSAASRGASERVFPEKGFTPRAAVTLSHSLPTVVPFRLRALRAPLHSRSSAFRRRSRHGHASPSRAFPVRGALNLVRNLLGRSAPAFARRIRVGATPLSDLAAGEFVLFVSYLSCGLALSISPFFLLLLEELGLQLQHLTPHSILQAAIFDHLCEMFVRVVPCTSLFRHFFVLVKSGKAKDHLGAYIPTFGNARWEN